MLFRSLRGQFNEAEECYNDASQTFEKFKGADIAIETAHMELSKGDLYRSQKPDKAMQYYKNALKKYRDTDNLIGQANTLQGMGCVESRFCKFNTVIEHFNEAKVLYESAHDMIGLGNILLRIGINKFRTRDISAKNDFEDAKKMFDSVKNEICSEIVNLYYGDWMRLEQPQNAGPILLKSLKAFQRYDEVPGQAHAHLRLGKLYTGSNDWDRAKEHLEKAIDLFEDKLGKSNAFYSMGLLQIMLGDLDSAVRNLKEAEGRLISINDRVMLSYVKKELSYCARRSDGDSQAAEKYLEDSKNLMGQVYALNPDLRDVEILPGMGNLDNHSIQFS